MCFNCGCEHPNDDMGNPDNITWQDFEAAALARNQPRDEAMRNTRELIDKILKAENRAPSDLPADKRWEPHLPPS